MLLETGEGCGVKAQCFPSSIFMFSCKSVFEPDKNFCFLLKSKYLLDTNNAWLHRGWSCGWWALMLEKVKAAVDDLLWLHTYQLSGVSLPHWFSGSLWSVRSYFVFLWVNLTWSRDANSVETARAVCMYLRQLQTWLLCEVGLKAKQAYGQRWAGRCMPLLSCPHPPRCGEGCWWGIMFSALHWTTFSVGKM